MKWLIFGASGWIGNQVCLILNKMGESIIHAKSRADNEKDVENEIIQTQPDRILSFIGRTFGPEYSTIDYLEQKGKLVENMKDNLYGPFVLTMLSKKYYIHFTYLGTGCIFDGYEGDSGNGYSEEAKPDFFGSSYSTVKGFSDKIMHMFDDTTLNCRIRMPACDDLSPRNFIIKIMTYKRICSTNNSMTVLPELLPIMLDMAKNKVTGTINLTNPGLINHNEILEMVKEIINPNLTWENFTIEEQDKVLLAGRSNNLLNTDKLQSMYPNILNVKDSMRKLIYGLKNNMDKN